MTVIDSVASNRASKQKGRCYRIVGIEAIFARHKHVALLRCFVVSASNTNHKEEATDAEVFRVRNTCIIRDDHVAKDMDPQKVDTFPMSRDTGNADET